MYKLTNVKIPRTALLFFGVYFIGCGSATKQDRTAPVAFAYDNVAVPDSGPRPWTNKNFENAPETFQFAVIGDRTGGADPHGIFDKAMDQLNLLRPEFVVNVGDVVEGYTDVEANADAMWDEVDNMVNKLDMPFFYTPGNHDLGNETMEKVWAKRHGPAYYHFIYQDVLFLILNSEDPSNPIPANIEEKTLEYKRLLKEDPATAQAMLAEFMESMASYKVPAKFSDEQVNYFKKVLAENQNVRWTFVFLHQPAWENPGPNFLAIEALLKDRPYTAIAGHLHYYNFEQRNGRDYITMGPAGASWHKNGPGNVDHFLWITMKEDGPEIAKIVMEGVFGRQGRDLAAKQLYDQDKSEDPNATDGAAEVAVDGEADTAVEETKTTTAPSETISK